MKSCLNSFVHFISIFGIEHNVQSEQRRLSIDSVPLFYRSEKRDCVILRHIIRRLAATGVSNRNRGLRHIIALLRRWQ